MEPSQLLPHLATALRMALGEKTLAGKPPPAIVAGLFRYFAIHQLKWPEGKIQSPAGAFETPSEGWEKDRTTVVELIERFAITPGEKLGAAHPSFGRMSVHDWDVLQYRHLDHHLRQFGV
jgi:hypothetical protein